MQTVFIILMATGAFAGVARFFAFGVRKMQTVDAALNSGAMPIGGAAARPIIFGAGFDGGSSSCADGGGCS